MDITYASIIFLTSPLSPPLPSIPPPFPFLRRGHEILRTVLLPKFEHVLLLRSSHVQRVLYDFNMDQLKQQGMATTSGPLKAFAVCSKV